MPDLLLELFSEEIPARMQGRAAGDLKRLVTDALVEAGLTYDGARAFATPRRLALSVHGLPGRQPDRREERKGPRVGAPDNAIQGFLKAAGLASIDQARVQDDGKGGFYVAVTEKPGRATLEVAAAILPGLIRDFPWPKSMRWGERSAASGALRWVRPLHTILCVLRNATGDTEIVPFEVDGITAGEVTFGHRFHAPGPIRVRGFDDYAPALQKAHVVLDAARRREMILADARDLALAAGLELVEDEALLEEVAGLVEWPVPLMGSFDEAFLAVPPEVIRSTIRANQKCFVLRRPGGEGTLANRFILVANIEATDGGAAITAGNERVVRARLSDARFFWEADLKVPLETRLEKLDQIIFHERLGSQGARVKRIEQLAREIAPRIGAPVDQAAEAARLAKADLVTETVGEFPELQGLVGRYLAGRQGKPGAVAAACEEHYKPQGPNDRTPAGPVSIAVALADKLDTLIGFWAIDEKPTGSKDPYALRRAALGVIRLVLDNGVRLPLGPVCTFAHGQISAALLSRDVARAEGALQKESSRLGIDLVGDGSVLDEEKRAIHRKRAVADVADLMSFLADRLKVQLREQGARHDLVDAVFALGGQDDLVLIVRRVEALGRLLDTDDGRNLLAGYKRAANILRAEEKKDGPGAFLGAVEPDLLAEPAERALLEALDLAETAAAAAVGAEDFEAAMRAFAGVRPAIDAFFDKVTVNAPEAELRTNRLRLLARLRAATAAIADFSRIEG